MPSILRGFTALKEIRFHGRGGQGAVTAAELLAKAVFNEGRYVQAFALFGAERRGAPVKAFARIDDKEILIRSQIYYPDYVVVLDSGLLGIIDVAEGLKEGGLVLINTRKKPEEIQVGTNCRLATVDATGIALELSLLVAGLPVVNTAILGAFARATNEVKLESVTYVIKETWPGKIGEKNAYAAELAFQKTFLAK